MQLYSLSFGELTRWLMHYPVSGVLCQQLYHTTQAHMHEAVKSYVHCASLCYSHVSSFVGILMIESPRVALLFHR